MTYLRVLLCFLIVSSCLSAEPPASKFPVLKALPVVGTKERTVSDSDYEKSMDVQPKLVLEGASVLAPIPALEATMIVITEDTYAKYTEHKEKYKILSVETLPIPAALNGDRRSFDFASSKTTFDSWRDTSNVGGSVYKYFIFGLRDPATKQLVDFQTNHPTLSTWCKSHPEKRDGYLKYRKGGAFIEKFD